MCVRQRRRWSPVHAGKTRRWIRLHRHQHDLDGLVRGGKCVVRGLGSVSTAFCRGEGEAQGVAGQNIGGLLARH